ncbi:hypothetical protein HDA32_005468 [Spinactinospora alkalitolerans]|uniref:Uncharacterized protein n=1 Tax=Spinactinospora alkalitolerans TaxID=687207 RepID=A0A852U2A3_9ACTN|nr:hypothetical protein [Spinactinospora alkalitolerans]NYE50348.1 hypothetical protein [Spinactinospora alkalitolerans]
MNRSFPLPAASGARAQPAHNGGDAGTRQIGEEETAAKLTGILRQEEEMARFLEEKPPEAVREAPAAVDR